jgi:perosamine synthetase
VRYPLSKPNLGRLELAYSHEAIATGWISGTGSFVQRFESALCAITAREYSIATSSGTSALDVVLQAIGVGPGDEVIVPALTFAAPAAAVLNAGATVVLCDVDPVHWTIDVAELSNLISSRTKAIVAVNIMGHPCDFHGLEAFGIPVIEDAAEAHGACYRGKPAGSFGVASIFSFHVNKAVTTGEGGAVLTDDPELAARCRMIANHGMTAELPYVHQLAGRNARLNNISAAIGLAQAERWIELTSAREAAWSSYRELLSQIPQVRARPVASWATHSCWLGCVYTSVPDEVTRRARRADIDVRRIWPALSRLPIYADAVRRSCPVAEDVSMSSIWLPTWAYMDPAEIGEIVATCWPQSTAC